MFSLPPADDVRLLNGQRATLYGYHKDLLALIRIISTRVKASQLTKEELVDCCLLLRDIMELAEDLKKETNALMEDAGDCAALLWTLDPTAKGPITGTLAKGIIKQKVYPKLPSKKHEPERHQILLEALGLRPGADANLFSISWPRLVDKLSAEYEAGLPLPAGIKPEELAMKPKLEVRRCKAE